MALDLTQKTGKPKPFTGARIIFGIKLPKNLEANLAAQKNPEHQALIKAYLREKDPERKKEKWEAVKASRVKLGISSSDEEE